MTNCKKCDRPVDMYSNTGLCTYHLLKQENIETYKRREVFFRTMTITWLILLASVTLIAGLRINALATYTSYFFALYLSILTITSGYLTYYYHKQW